MPRDGLHVGVDARVLAERPTGVAVYTRLLLRHLLLSRERARLTLFSHRPIPRAVLDSIDSSGRISVCCRRCPSPMLVRPLWDHGLLPMAARGRELDLFFSPLSVVPRGLPVPTVVTVHDLGFLHSPAVQPLKYRVYWRAALRRAGRTADRLIAVSQSTAWDAVALLGVDPERVDVVYEAVDPFFLEAPSADEESGTLESLGLEPGYLLSVGTLEPRKNYNALFAVFGRLRQSRPDLRWIIVGAPGWLCEETVRKIRSEPERILWLEDADNETVRVLYRNASLFLFPSLYEGFGLPVLEAMACGTPVVASDAGSLPEVAGEAAVCVPARDPDAVFEAAAKLLEEESLREAYRRKGYDQVRRFSWEETARRTWQTFDKVIQD